MGTGGDRISVSETSTSALTVTFPLAMARAAWMAFPFGEQKTVMAACLSLANGKTI